MELFHGRQFMLHKRKAAGAPDHKMYKRCKIQIKLSDN